MIIEPLTGSDIMHLAVNNKPIPLDRALATFADRSNWTHVYVEEIGAHKWIFLGPVIPPYELAENALYDYKKHAYDHSPRDNQIT